MTRDSSLDSLLERARTVEEVQVAYGAWEELRRLHESLLRRLDSEELRLGLAGNFLLGAVHVAQRGSVEPSVATDALALSGSLEVFEASSQARLDAARAAIQEERTLASDQFAAAEATLQLHIVERLRRQAVGQKPWLRMTLQSLPRGRSILQLERLVGDAPAQLFYLFTGLIPTHHGFFEDESTDTSAKGPTCIYPGEGISGEQLRLGPAALLEALGKFKVAFPIKACLPFPVGSGLWRLVPRGAVVEVECGEGDSYRNILTSAEAELAAGTLLRWKLEGMLELELKAG